MTLSKTSLKNVVVGPAILALLTAAVAVAVLLSWSATQADNVTRRWQEGLVAGFADKIALDTAASLEMNTRWDDAVRQTHRPVVDKAWLDGVYGPFIYTKLQWGRVESYVLDSNDRPYYAATSDSRIDPNHFAQRASLVRPMLAELRRKMRHPDSNIDYAKWKSPGVADIQNVDGSPVLVILKPIVSDTGKLVQKPDDVHVHVFLSWLDSASLHKWATRYDLDGVRFSWTGEHSSSEEDRPMLSSRAKQPRGYFIWRPYRPGLIVLRDMILPLLGALMIIGLVTWSLIRRVLKSTAQLRASEAQARHLAFHDVLTGLPNRAFFDKRLEKALAAARRADPSQVALLLLDLDRFKWVNDTLGHPAGDELIREVARRLAGLLNRSDTAARLGGDEFAIILNNVQSNREIDSFCRRIDAALNTPFDLIGSQAHVGVSIGIARAPIDSVDRSELTRKADIALYHAKAAGRGCHRIFSKKMDTSIQFRRRIERDLRLALAEGGQLELYYQPQYDAASMVMTGVEALVRWNHPELGLLCPTTFVPIAEESGLIEVLGEWVLKEACVAGQYWGDLIVSVNVSAVQLRNPRFADHVLKVAAATRFDLERLELEITETSLLENLVQCETNLVALRATGVRIALDDFGTGYSSLSHLRTFRIDRVKIDRSFIRGLEDSTGVAIIQAIVHLAHSTGLKITAEGVETAKQTQFLCAVGCDELQGFGLSTPLPLQAFEEMYRLSLKTPEKRRLAA